MPAIEDAVADHYTTEDLLGRIAGALEASGVDPHAPLPEDLKAVDEFHTGGLAATDALLDQVPIDRSTRVLDIGSGLGGTARHIAHRYGPNVTGVDLTLVFVETARALSALVGLEGKTHYLEGSALELPIQDASADLATLFHVGMNISDKAAMFAEAARVLAPGGIFALFDVMQVGAGPLTFPFPWAEEAQFSFVDSPAVYRQAAEQAGLDLAAERDRRDFALDYFAQVFAKIGAEGPPALGIHLLMRETAGQKLQNYVACCEAGLIAPVEMIFRKPA